MAMLEIYNTLPDFAPQPHAYGKCADEDAYFFLCDYLTIGHALPDPVQLGEKLAELHKKSESPTGKFGFHVTTFDGKLPLNTTWDSSVSIRHYFSQPTARSQLTSYNSGLHSSRNLCRTSTF